MNEWLIVILTLIFSGIFSGLEIAFISANKFRISLQASKNRFPYVMLAQLSANPARFIATMLVGNNLMLVLYGMFITALLPFSNLPSAFMILLAQTLVSTVFILFFAEFIPKNIFSTHSEAALKIFSLPAWVFYMLFYPVVSFTIWLSQMILGRLFGMQLATAEPAFTKLDLNDLLTRHRDNHENPENIDPEIEILKNALGFSERKAREFMIPRTEMVALEIGDSVEKLQHTFIQHGFSKIVIYGKNIDNVLGYVHSYDMFSMPTTIRQALKPILFVPESMTADDVLNLFTRERKSLAVVVDEFGGTSGLITLEDVVEEIVGEIDDEHDTEDLLDKQISENSFLFAARAEIDYINEKYRLALPESENYSTLGGFIFEIHESIPAMGEKIQHQNYLIEIKKVSSNRIEEVLLTIYS
jgi:putative hemolysin